MKEILSKLLESKVLTEETVTQLESAITEAIDTAVTTARETAIVEAQADVARQWEVERTALIEAIDGQITEGVTASVAELNEARVQLENMKVDLSKRYIQRERQLAENVRTEMGDLVEDLDVFMKKVVEAHLVTVSDDLKAIKEDNFGREIFKAFAQEFASRQLGSNVVASITATTKVTEAKLNTALEENARLRSQLSESSRQTKVKELLAPLAGESRKVMEALLTNVPMKKLDESFKTYLPRVLKNSEKEKSQVLAEGNKAAATPAARKPARRTMRVDGSTPRLPTRSTPEQLNESAADDASIAHLQKVAGIRHH